MMSLQLGETFSSFKIQRPVQWVVQTPNPLLFKYNELPKIFAPPLVSKGLLRPSFTTIACRCPLRGKGKGAHEPKAKTAGAYTGFFSLKHA